MSKKHLKTIKETSYPPYLDFLFDNKWVGLALIVVVLSTMFFKIGFLHYEPTASDAKQWRYTANETLEYNKQHSEPALWNTRNFCGMPTYLISFSEKYPFVNEIIKSVNNVINWKLAFMLVGAIGIFFLLRYLGLQSLIAAILALAFSLSSHYVALLEMGHNTKFQAIMLLPWLLFSFLYLKDKKNLLGVGFFAVSLIAELRANHLQITYYLFLFMGIFWVYELVMAIKNKELKSHSIFTGLLILGFVISALAVANPHLSNFEYSAFTIRGGETGLTKAYAQSWSMHPAEFIELLFPDFFGGISNFNDNGKSYWGWMSFTQAYHYTGIIVLLFGVLALFYSKNKYRKVLWIGVFAALIMSMGKYFPLLSNFLHDYLPGFNKFRVPATHLVVLQLLMIVLAGFGLKAILKKSGDEKLAKGMKIALIVVSLLFIFNITGGTTIFSGLSFTSASEIAQYKEYIGTPQFETFMKGQKAERLTLLVNSVRNGLFFLGVALGLIFFYCKKMLSKYIFIALIGIMMIADLSVVNSAYFKQLSPKQPQKELPFNKIDNYLLANQPTGSYRVFTRDNFNDVSWSAHLQILGGYHGAKIKRFNQILENAMNMNVINMLNAKYIITKDNLGVTPLVSMQKGDTPQYLYPNPSAQERAWFVDRLVVKADENDRLEFLNSATFNPATVAIVEENIAQTSTLGKGDVTFVEQENYIHDVVFNIENLNKDGFLVVSEIYYPAGWKAFVDGKETKIYPVDHILRGVEIPANSHKLEMVFAPESYKLSKKLSLIGLLLASGMFIGGVFLLKKKKSLD